MNKIEDPKLKEWVDAGMELFLNRAENEQIGEWIKSCPRLIRMTQFDDDSELILTHSFCRPDKDGVIVVNKFSFMLQL